MDSLPRNVTSTAEEKFKRLVVPEIEMLTRVAGAITRNHAEAEDLVQETLLRAFRAIDRFDGSNPRPWLLTIMRNANINMNRRRRPRLLNDPDLVLANLEARQSSEDVGPDEAVVSNEFVGLVRDAVLRLPQKYREVITLVDMYGLSYPETAAILGIPVGTVMSRVHRGRTRIRREIPVERYLSDAIGNGMGQA
jgi:RNA polymerase sigma-70 factor (ECF subfamily)